MGSISNLEAVVTGKGPARLFAFMCEQARYRDQVYFCADETAAQALGVCRRTVIRWRQQLEHQGHIERVGTHRWTPLKTTVIYRFVTQRSTSGKNLSSSSVVDGPKVVNFYRARVRKAPNMAEILPLFEDPDQHKPKRRTDLAFEALARVTHANPEIERGKLNKALKGIRWAWAEEGGLEADLPAEIELRAVAYQNMFPNMPLTPIPLAAHWLRVIAQAKTRSPQQQAIDELRKEI